MHTEANKTDYSSNVGYHKNKMHFLLGVEGKILTLTLGKFDDRVWIEFFSLRIRTGDGFL